MELGFIAGRSVSLGTLDPEVQRAVIGAPTGFARVAAVSGHLHRENSTQKRYICPEGENVRVICDMLGFQSNPFVGFAEWRNLQGIVSILRSAAGPDWSPVEITFVARGKPSDAAPEAYGNTRILTGRCSCSVLVPATALAQTCSDRKLNADGTLDANPANGALSCAGTPSESADAWDFVSALRATTRPYLAQGYPQLSMLAQTLPGSWSGSSSFR